MRLLGGNWEPTGRLLGLTLVPTGRIVVRLTGGFFLLEGKIQTVVHLQGSQLFFFDDSSKILLMTLTILIGQNRRRREIVIILKTIQQIEEKFHVYLFSEKT